MTCTCPKPEAIRDYADLCPACRAEFEAWLDRRMS